MRIFLLFFIFLVLNQTSVQGQQNPQLQFDQANTYLEESSFIEAMKLYKSIENSGYVSGPLFLNMGIVAMELDSMGLAKYYFLKAKNFSSTEAQALESVEYVRAQFSRQSAVLPKLPWDKAVDALKKGPGALGVFIVGFVFIICAVSLIILLWFKKISLAQPSRILFPLVAGSILVVLLAFYVDYVDQRYSEAVIIAKEIPVTQQPNTNADLISLAYEGYMVTIDQFESRNANGWFYIRLGNGQYGWIQDSGFKTL